MESPFFQDSRVVVTGASGTVGEELVRQLLALPVAEVRALDNNESALFFLGESHRADHRLQCFLSDVRDSDKITRMFQGMDFVFHTAAFKHVPLCERSPFDAVQTNIVGVQNVVQAALSAHVKRVLFTSSDKAVNPTNVMGTSKLMGERLITAANAVQTKDDGIIFTSTRFGNVAGSRGSVIPLFTQQIAQGGPISLTDPDMTRFIMTLEESVRLVMESLQLARGGEVFVTKMPVMRIQDLAETMVELLAPLYGYAPEDIEIKLIGARPGEKMYEELMSEEELRRSWELDQLFAVLPAWRNIYANVEYFYPNLTTKTVTKVYHSANEPVMSKDEIRRFLFKPRVLPVEVLAMLRP